MGLQDVISEDRRRVFHNDTDGFAELVSIEPPSGAARDVYVHVVSSEVVELDDENNTARQVERIQVKVLRDEAAVHPDATLNITLGGFAKPEIGTRLIRNTDYDVSDRPYVWKGEVGSRTLHSHNLIFERYRQTEQGAA